MKMTGIASICLYLIPENNNDAHENKQLAPGFKTDTETWPTLHLQKINQ